MSRLMIMIVTTALLLLGGRSALAALPVAEPLPVVASFSILGDLVRQVGGDAVTVTVLVGADADAHQYQPTSADMQAVGKAALIVSNGLGFEPWLLPLLKASGYKGSVITASATVVPRHAESAGEHPHGRSQHHDETASDLDPHAWQDLQNGQRYVTAIAAALTERLPAQAAAIAARATAYQHQLAALDQRMRADIATLQPAQRVVVTSHDAFGYFAAAYGIKFYAPQGLSTESEPTAKALAQLITQIQQLRVKTVFVDTIKNPRLIAQLAKDAGATVGGTLYADALSAADGAAPTYIGMFEHTMRLLLPAMRQIPAPPP
jgi:zinc/manganese transport system substrate-binding protein